MNNLTGRRIVILSALSSGPKTWAYLRMVYFPTAERQANKASTSFCNQLIRMQDKGLIQKTLLGYIITEEGINQMAEVVRGS
jgi:hypothetical protein